jgi:hypothetical protein
MGLASLADAQKEMGWDVEYIVPAATMTNNAIASAKYFMGCKVFLESRNSGLR